MLKAMDFFANKTESRFKQALNDAWAFLYPMLPYLFIGVFIGAFIYGFVPETFITKYASGGGIISVFIASIIGIPMYIRPETMLPIAEALASKGMSLGTVVALIIGGAGASIPEVVLLSKLFKKRVCSIVCYRHFSCSYFYRFDCEHRYLKEGGEVMGIKDVLKKIKTS